MDEGIRSECPTPVASEKCICSLRPNGVSTRLRKRSLKGCYIDIIMPCKPLMLYLSDLTNPRPYPNQGSGSPQANPSDGLTYTYEHHIVVAPERRRTRPQTYLHPNHVEHCPTLRDTRRWLQGPCARLWNRFTSIYQRSSVRRVMLTSLFPQELRFTRATRLL